jgi:diguanylate cyclase (GGDEF)-like protein
LCFHGEDAQFRPTFVTVEGTIGALPSQRQPIFWYGDKSGMPMGVNLKLQDYLSPGPPDDPIARKAFAARNEQFFRFASHNVRSLMLGAILICATLLYEKADPVSVLIWMVFLLIAGTWLLWLSYTYKRTSPEGDRLVNYLRLRIVSGSSVGLLYGVSPFLLPAESSGTGEPLLIIMILVISAIAIFQYSILPAYYVAFNLMCTVPLIAYLTINANAQNLIYLLFVVGSIVTLVSIGLTVSRDASNVILLNIKLNEEIQGHIETKKQLEKMALQDHLTGLGNRRMFEDIVEKDLAKARRDDTLLSILYIDLNDFKLVNDEQGHEIGDLLLKEVAARISSNIRASDSVARVGGDEFTVLLPNCPSTSTPAGLLDKLNAALNQDLMLEGKQLSLSASIGMAIYPEDGQTIDELMKAADKNMYRQKDAIKSARF